MSTILFTKESGIARITFNRPKAFNSFNREMAFAFQDALDDCQNDDSVRVVVVSGEGKAFCAGQDLKEVTDEKLNPGFKNILDEHYGPIIKKIRATKDKDQKNKLKQKLPAICFSGTFTKRNNRNYRAGDRKKIDTKLGKWQK